MIILNFLYRKSDLGVILVYVVVFSGNLNIFLKLFIYNGDLWFYDKDGRIIKDWVLM